jgi:hypothetical protein
VKELQQAEVQLEQASSALREAIQAEELGQQAEQPKKKKKKKDKGLGSQRGVETLFRSAYRVQMDLTGLADNKANMMISINGIIISILIAAVAPKLDANPWLMAPTTVFLLGTLISIIFAILAARPRVASVPITLSDLRNSKGNILFFGNFSRLSEDDFVEGMIDLMENQELVYETMVRNLYGIGSVLRLKFHYLKIAYNAFMAALVLAVVSFVSVFVWIFVSMP